MLTNFHNLIPKNKLYNSGIEKSKQLTYEVWKYWVITCLMTLFSEDTKKSVIPSIKNRRKTYTQ